MDQKNKDEERCENIHISAEELGVLVSPELPQGRYDLRILSSIRRIIRSVDIHSRKLIQDYGVTVPQLICMLKIDELGPLAMKDLAAEVYLNPSTVVGIVDRLEKNGILARERSVRDRRKVRVLLTEKGKQMVGKVPFPLQDRLASSIDQLPELEKATIALSLEKILDMLDSKALNAEHGTPIEAAPVLETAPDLKMADEAF